MSSRAASRYGLGYAEDPGGAAADYSWRLFVIAYSSPLAGLVYLLFGPAEPTRWAWIAVGLTCLALAVGIGVFETIETTRSNVGNATPPLRSLVLTMSVLVAILAMDVGVTPDSGSLRWLLLVPALITATFGNRTLFAVVAASSLGLLVMVRLAIGGPVGQLVVELLAAVAFLAIVRVFAVRTLASFARDLLFGSMSEVAATVDSLDDGWSHLLPIVCDYLVADQMVLAEVGDDAELQELVSWPPGRPSLWEVPAVRELAIRALMTRNPVHTPDEIAVPVDVSQGRQLVAVVGGAHHRFIVDMYQETRAHHVAQQLGVLVNRIQMIEGLERLTRTDTLTGLPNRRALLERLTAETSAARRSPSPLCAAMIDLDLFKSYNDDYGHLEGDHALEAVAALMAGRLRSSDLAARYGGEEFAVVLPNVDEAGAQRLLDELRGHMAGLELNRPLTISVGIARWSEGESPETLLTHADQALYLAKAGGRDQCRAWRADPSAAEPADLANGHRTVMPR